jgi:O-antigen/teichoic acid export membrane protein
MKSDKEFLAKGSLISGLGLVTRIVSPALVILLARFYPQGELGLFITFQALVLTLSRLSVLGLDKGLLWYVPRMEGQGRGNAYGLADSLLVASLISLLFLAVFAVAGATGLIERIESLRGRSLPFILLMIGSVWPIAAVQLFSSALEGKRLPQYRVVLALFLTTSLVPLIALLLKQALGDALSLAAGLFLGNFIGFLSFLPVIRARFAGEAWSKASWPNAELMRYSWPMAGSELVGNLLVRADLWMLLLLLGPEKVAVYAVMVTITNGLRTVRQAFDPLLIPIVSRMGNEDLRTKLRGPFSYATNMVSSIQLLIVCFLMVFPREILSLAGKDYAIEIFAFGILMVGNLVNGFLGLNGWVVLGMGRSRFNLLVNVCALPLNLICNWIFIPRLGIAGAALSATLTLLSQNLAHYVYVRFVSRLALYEPHLYLNAGLEIAFLGAFFAVYHRVEALSLAYRAGLFSAVFLGLGLALLLKRKSYVLR